ncbi:Crp/Fnr family transcriptional regulator [Aureibacter tunicatorum]|uniref:CRP-like cAMP-binding protein n=1 Tax=Aureibacter tunicatorum TaxID=866807 RepID=A0AAE3XMD4_9BACT|nr:Crp/Fnr family transcriptional regulator [Aureibacter tunicatorum]MDR6239150.1 CRP-like cAMP-binding protein [Aureibacter tunicatorum]BDD04924.1 cyclic nucleotide-binding protein [Aureibacter tunicatorum]
MDFNSFFQTHGKLEQFEANHPILRPPEVCRKVYLIKSGSVRGFYYDNKGNDISTWFSFENDMITLMQSFMKQTPSHYGLETMEPVVSLSISREQAFNFFYQDIETAKAFHAFTFDIMSQIIERLSDMQMLTAKERYEKLIASQPKIFAKASLGDIASYLGVTQQSLSRIRSQKH